MAKRGGYGGMGMMPGNMNNLMKQAQKMQKQMEETTKALEEKEYEATAGGGVVKVKINGKKEVTEVHLDEEVVDKDDIEMLEDLIMAAMNEAIRMQDEDQKNSKHPTPPLFPYYQYAGRTGGKPVGSNHRCKEEYPVLQILLYDY